ncbi:hypothetical protein J2R98_001531 [Alkalibacillus filiformis]|uniref:DUF2062 domain-containing protein n=1 Tax=Alkalibacillus filiformis TaxID=200990 RepID=A0ABU0DTP8_9BACI|nr:hypothetical protein [Alkalibacillus filiformis]MDQ0351714.1 hypothetical protein [Alkalibacillus filiformis]
MKEYKKEIILILIPFIYGFIANTFMIILPPMLIQIVFGVFWFWVGMRFAKVKANHLKNILVGNSLWLISFLIYLWQFVLVNDEGRNTVLAMFSQHYPFTFISSGTQLSLMFSDMIHGTVLTIFSYLMMFIVFMGGYITSWIISKKMFNHNK